MLWFYRVLLSNLRALFFRILFLYPLDCSVRIWWFLCAGGRLILWTWYYGLWWPSIVNCYCWSWILLRVRMLKLKWLVQSGFEFWSYHRGIGERFALTCQAARRAHQRIKWKGDSKRCSKCSLTQKVLTFTVVVVVQWYYLSFTRGHNWSQYPCRENFSIGILRSVNVSSLRGWHPSINFLSFNCSCHDLHDREFCSGWRV